MQKLKNIAYSVERRAYRKLSAIRYPLNAKIFLFPALLSCILNFIGCATTPYTAPPKPQFAMPGMYHHVEKGQTLWRISKLYNVDLDEIVRINRMPDATSIEPGQLIFIPSVQKKPYLPDQSSKEDFSWPLKGKVIASFGQTFNSMINKGINIQRIKGQDIIASRSGKVTFYDTNFDGFGKTIIIDHGDGFSTVYARNSEVFVKIGDYVQKGNVIAKVGSSDRDKNTYLHFEIRKGYIPQNPYFYLP
ncbi:MAG: LysM peptidoglycan-binding domain-containing M23 family metallopeptidase [Candidatus Omnitrophota bacterium]|nr:LysM peptidoglycan-binding domain-containing M23 family metallopeptidase [Candidatus Omnitrophota bacterium]